MSLWEWTASDVAAGIRNGAISSAEAVESCLSRVEEVNGALNAIVEVDADGARAAAAAADDAVRRGDDLGPLHGVPVTIKVNTNQVGFANTNGVAALQEPLATENDPQVQSWLDAGAVSVGRTNTPPFSFRWFTENELYGITRNPWDPARSPGGSSGGAAVALATGMCALAHGNDIGGSIRFPAACCGITGIRPTVGRVPGWYGPVDLDPLLSVQIFLVQGPLARTVGDLRIGLRAMEAPDPRDPWHAPVSGDLAPLRRPIRVGIVADPATGDFTAPPDPAVRESLDLAAGWLRDAGYEVEEVQAPQLGEAARLWWQTALPEVREFLLPIVNEVGDEGIRTFVDYLFTAFDDEFGEVGLATYMGGYARRGMLLRQLHVLMEDVPILLTPMAAEPPYRLGEDLESAARARELMSAQWPSMAVPFLGVPGISVPVRVHDGLPIGVQLIGRRFREDTLFDAAEVIEARSDVRTPIDPRSG